jgi:hypothetical protein
LSLDYTFLNFTESEDSKTQKEENNFNISIYTSWITKQHIIFGWGLVYNQFTLSEDASFQTYYLNLNLGYLF